MSYVFDSSSLIYLGKLKLLEKINLRKKFIPEEVYREVVEEGFKKYEEESKYIKKIIEENKFIIKKPKENIVDFPLLSNADKEVISLAKETKAIAIIDENYAKQIAKSFGIESHGSLFILIKLIEQKEISKEQAINYIDKIIEFGFYLSTKKYREILNLIKKL